MRGSTLVVGLFESRRAAESAVEDLKSAGFRNEDVSVLFRHGDEMAETKTEKHTKAPEGATAGAGTGALVGGTLGWLAGIGSLAIPGLGPFIAAGPIMGLLAGVGAGGTAGGVVGGLIGLGMPEYEAKKYENKVSGGDILMSVYPGDMEEVAQAKEILARHGAKDVHTAEVASV